MNQLRKAGSDLTGGGIGAFWRASVRPWHVVLLACVAWIFLVSFLKSSWVSEYGGSRVEFARQSTGRVLDLFPAYFTSFDEHFKPEIEKFIKDSPGLSRLTVSSTGGQLLFDSRDLANGKTIPRKLEHQLLSHSSEPIVVSDPAGLGIYHQRADYTVYYVFTTTTLTMRALTYGLIGCLVLSLLGLAWPRVSSLPWLVLRSKLESPVGSLRAKFVFAIVGVNLLIGGLIFFAQSYNQKKWLTERTVRSSIVAAESMRDQIVAIYSNYYFFYYGDRFVPAIRQLMASRENLIRLKVVSRKSGTVAFDSSELEGARPVLAGNDGQRAELPAGAEEALKTQQTFHQILEPAGEEPRIRVVSAYLNESRESPFLVDYEFSFASLNEWLYSLQKQILLDMIIPSLVLGVLIALLFAQFVVGPVRRLVAATRSIAGGNYDVELKTSSKDEIAELMTSFTAMAGELKRKTELKKYLSEHTYRRIVEAPGGISNVTGARVRATILFCDIRNFSNVCELLDAEEVTSLLNDYFSSMVEVITKHRGEVDKFIGDAILAVFYDQDEARLPANTALHAIYCGMEMREKLAEFNARRLAANKTAVEIGVGITSGEIISGPIGSPDRRDFTVIGDAVNLASRIEKLSKKGTHTRIVFSNHVEQKVRGLLDYEELSRDKIRGKEEEVIVYELVKIREVRELLSSLSHPDVEIKRHCIELLGYSRNQEALVPLYQKLSDSNETVRIAAVTAVARLSPPEHAPTLDVLFRHLRQEDSERVLAALLIALGKLCRSQRLLEVSHFLENDNDRIVANAIEALGASEDPKVIDLLIPFITSKNNRVKANAAMVLFAKGRIEVMEALKPMLLHSDPMMRASAAFALGELTVLATAEGIASRIRSDSRLARHFLAELQGCVPLLVSLLRDNDPIVKRQAILALGKVKDKSSVLPLIDSLELTLDSKELVRDVAEALRSIGSHRLVREVVKQLV